ncbi:Uncharacterized phage protein gp47/JayE [Ensifer adhaerens]|nr:Uncharacterized phage protein gp47/JayE [Ensifer adhaerens]
MVWKIPAASKIFARMAAAAETGILTLRPGAEITAVSRAVRSAKGVFAHFFSPIAAEIRELHDHQAWWGRQYMPDSADDEAMILRHANIWGVQPREAVKAVGSVAIEAASGTIMESGIELSSSTGVLYITTVGGTVGVSGVITLSARAQAGGADGNLEAGVKLSTVDAYPEITGVTVVTAFSGGTDDEAPESVQARYLERIREPPKGGAAPDYKAWALEVADVYAVNVVEDWIGRGSVGVVIVMKDEAGNPRVPTVEELDAIASYIGPQGSQTGVRPVTARVIMVAGELVEIPITVAPRPNTATVKAAIASAFARFVATIGDDDDEENASPIGAAIEPSRISEAISAADGEYAHDLAIPAARYVLGSKQCPIPGTITWA